MKMLFTRITVRRISRQLAFLLEEDRTLQEALELVAMQQSRRWSNILLAVRQQLREGESLPVALVRSRAFGKKYCDTVAWAERQGDARSLSLALRLLADDTGRPVREQKQKENDDLLRWKYPLHAVDYSGSLW